jgi:multidrug efflux pump subunit AcrA (membrane-fusion protein)
VTVPLAAVHEEDRRTFVYIYDEGRLGKRYVQAGFTGGGYVQIISGLEAGVRVVILP